MNTVKLTAIAFYGIIDGAIGTAFYFYSYSKSFLRIPHIRN